MGPDAPSHDNKGSLGKQSFVWTIRCQRAANRLGCQVSIVGEHANHCFRDDAEQFPVHFPHQWSCGL